LHDANEVHHPSSLAKTENFMTYAYIFTVYVKVCIRIHRVHGVSLYNVGDGCTAKTEIIFNLVAVVNFPFLLYSCFFNFSSVSVIVNRI